MTSATAVAGLADPGPDRRHYRHRRRHGGWPGAASRALTALSGDLRAFRGDVVARRAVPRELLLSLDRGTEAADTACGTVHFVSTVQL